MHMQVKKHRMQNIVQLVLVVGYLACHGNAVAAIFELPDGPFRLDETIYIQLNDLDPGQTVTLRGSSVDASGNAFQSFATFEANDMGTIDLTTMAPLGGSYEGIDPMGLFWSMDVASPNTGRQNFDLGGMASVEVRLEAFSGGDLLAHRVVRRLVRSSEVRVEELAAGNLVGELYRPMLPGRLPAVIVIGGSEGGTGGSQLIAEMLAARGYIALSLSYFSHEGVANHPQDLAEIPLEYFLEAINWLRDQESVDEMRVAMIGGSKGAEAALLVASLTDRLNRVIAIAPSSVVWQAPFSAVATSSWSYEGIPLPYVRYRRDPSYNPPAGYPNRLVHHYRYSMEIDRENVAAQIAIERLTADVLLVSGQDDLVWESHAASQAIMSRLDQAGSTVLRRNASYAGAGHSFVFGHLPTTWTPGMHNQWPNGGTPRANAIAAREGWQEMLDFLSGM